MKTFYGALLPTFHSKEYYNSQGGWKASIHRAASRISAACVSHTELLSHTRIVWFVASVYHPVFYKAVLAAKMFRVGVGRNTCRQEKNPLNLLLWPSEFYQDNRVCRGYSPRIITRSRNFLALDHRIKKQGAFQHHHFDQITILRFVPISARSLLATQSLKTVFKVS